MTFPHLLSQAWLRHIPPSQISQKAASLFPFPTHCAAGLAYDDLDLFTLFALHEGVYVFCQLCCFHSICAHAAHPVSSHAGHAPPIRHAVLFLLKQHPCSMLQVQPMPMLQITLRLTGSPMWRPCSKSSLCPCCKCKSSLCPCNAHDWFCCHSRR